MRVDGKASLKSLFVGFASVAVATVGVAQKGDRRDDPGYVQREVWREFDVPPAPRLNPEQALESFTVQDGFSIELVAAEPLVNDPVAIAWDEDGRLFAVEMWTFMPDPDGTGEDLPNGRIVVMEDLDQDGQMDRSTVYLDNLVMPRAIAIVEGGTLVAEPPTLWFCEDLDGDLKVDRKTKVVDYAAVGNVEHSENALMRGIDNWIYNARSNRRFKWDGQAIAEEETLSRGQWGMTMDDYGRIFYTNNSTLLMSDYYPSHLSNRNSGYKSSVGSGRKIQSENRVYSNRPNPGVNRGYYPGGLSFDNRLVRATAVSGPVIYRGDKYPERYQGDAFSTEPGANLITRLQLSDTGIELSADKMTSPDEKWGRLDFLTSTDERFRPVNLYNGPDGYLYIVDMYRGILQHREFLTTFLRKQIIERGLDEPVGLGRIYRLVHKDSPRDFTVAKMSEFTQSELVSALSDKNGWVRDTAQRLLAELVELVPDTRDALAETVLQGEEIPAIHAIWVLEAHGELDNSIVEQALSRSEPWVQIHTLWAAEPLFSKSNPDSPLRPLLDELLESTSIKVRLQAVQTLGSIPDAGFVLQRASTLFHPDIDSPHFVDALISSLNGHEVPFLESSLKRDLWLYSEGRSELLKKLVQILHQKGYAKDIENIIARLDTFQRWKTEAVLQSLAEVGTDKEKEPIELSADPSPQLKGSLGRKPERLPSILEAFTWPGKQVEEKREYTGIELESILRGEKHYNAYCTACHGPDGKGVAGIAPTLNDTTWVNESPQRLALIVSQGLTGPVEVKGEVWNAAMPANGSMPGLQAEGLADLLSYLRTAWNNDSGPVTWEEIEPTLKAHQDQPGAWTVETLEAAGH